MKPIRTALAGATLALAATGAFAAPGDAWYGTNRDTERVIVTEPHFGPLQPGEADRVTVYYDEPSQPAPAIVEREYATAPAYDVVVVEPVRDNDLFVVEPRTHPRIGRGLFPDRGPNDFGQ
ncbi:MAG TPA: hypothetical protein VFP44_03910 [Usitatibacter sp.]|nr:hypothetical protein [Usitatibacter sp.]